MSKEVEKEKILNDKISNKLFNDEDLRDYVIAIICASTNLD